METKVNTDLTNFRMETRKWLEDNCPLSMREPTKDPSQLYWGGRNGEFSSDDQKLWFERMYLKVSNGKSRFRFVCFRKKGHVCSQNSL